MFRLKKLGLAFVFICISILTISYSVQAGETYKWHGTGYTTKFEQVEVGDVEGHIMAIYQANQVFINDNTGEKTVSISTSTMDINPKTGLVTVEGYGVSKAPNGDVLIRKHEGKAVGKGQVVLGSNVRPGESGTHKMYTVFVKPRGTLRLPVQLNLP